MLMVGISSGDGVVPRGPMQDIVFMFIIRPLFLHIQVAIWYNRDKWGRLSSRYYAMPRVTGNIAPQG